MYLLLYIPVAKITIVRKFEQKLFLVYPKLTLSPITMHLRYIYRPKNYSSPRTIYKTISKISQDSRLHSFIPRSCTIVTKKQSLSISKYFQPFVKIIREFVLQISKKLSHNKKSLIEKCPPCIFNLHSRKKSTVNC